MKQIFCPDCIIYHREVCSIVHVQCNGMFRLMFVKIIVDSEERITLCARHLFL
jgi:hypothetical protein